jgi:PqqD family protein of HPr-rel-A system
VNRAWHLNTLASLHWRCWDDEWAVFDVGSGQTHQMDTLTAVTLMVVGDAPVALAELASRVAAELLVANNQELLDTLNGVLHRLVTAGLIESAVP